MDILRLTQQIRYGLTPLPLGTLPSATSYMLETLGAIAKKDASGDEDAEKG